MKILVTGANGLLGTEIISEFLDLGDDIIGVAGPTAKAKLDSGDPRYSFALDISDPSEIGKLTEVGTVDVVVHAAGLAHQFGRTSENEFESVNVEGSRNVARIASELNATHLILISSTSVYGMPTKRDEQFDEESRCVPATAYAESKLRAEEAVREFCEAQGMSLTIFRLAPVLGENCSGNAARLIGEIDKGRFVWIGNGRNLKSLIYKRDVARACVSLAYKKRAGTEIFNISSPPIEMRAFVNAICQSLGKKPLPITIPPWAFRPAFWINERTLALSKIKSLAQTVEKWLSTDLYSSRKIREEYGFEPVTGVTEAVKLQTEAFKREKEN